MFHIEIDTLEYSRVKATLTAMRLRFTLCATFGVNICRSIRPNHPAGFVPRLPIYVSYPLRLMPDLLGFVPESWGQGEGRSLLRSGGFLPLVFPPPFMTPSPGPVDLEWCVAKLGQTFSSLTSFVENTSSICITKITFL